MKKLFSRVDGIFFLIVITILWAPVMSGSPVMPAARDAEVPFFVCFIVAIFQIIVFQIIVSFGAVLIWIVKLLITLFHKCEMTINFIRSIRERNPQVWNRICLGAGIFFFILMGRYFVPGRYFVTIISCSNKNSIIDSLLTGMLFIIDFLLAGILSIIALFFCFYVIFWTAKWLISTFQKQLIFPFQKLSSKTKKTIYYTAIYSSVCSIIILCSIIVLRGTVCIYCGGYFMTDSYWHRFWSLENKTDSVFCHISIWPLYYFAGAQDLHRCQLCKKRESYCSKECRNEDYRAKDICFTCDKPRNTHPIVTRVCRNSECRTVIYRGPECPTMRWERWAWSVKEGYCSACWEKEWHSRVGEASTSEKSCLPKDDVLEKK